MEESLKESQVNTRSMTERSVTQVSSCRELRSSFFKLFLQLSNYGTLINPIEDILDINSCLIKWKIFEY